MKWEMCMTLLQAINCKFVPNLGLKRDNPTIGAGRRRCDARLGLFGLLAAAFLVAGSAPASTAPNDVTCESGDVCRIVKTRLPLRVLPRVNSNIYRDKDSNSPVIEANVPAFVPLFVFDRAAVSYDDPIRPRGWFRVGKT